MVGIMEEMDLSVRSLLPQFFAAKKTPVAGSLILPSLNKNDGTVSLTEERERQEIARANAA